ncbi:MAG: hypothetical protein WD226_05395, partial [Planctomycetota bacterium]
MEAPSPAETRRPSRRLWHEAPEDVLARIVPGDSLRLWPIVAERLRAHALFLDARAVAMRSFAAVALADEAPLAAAPASDRAARRRQRAALEAIV